MNGHRGNINSEKLLNRFVTLWGFSEAAFGGFLHLVKFPFRGMFIGGNAVILISLISYFSKNKRILLRSTMLVILVKFIISPYTPLTAYFAVGFQGVTGFLLYRVFSYNSITIIVHSIISQIQSSLQKFIGLTIYFGFTFWDSINIYIQYILDKFGFDNLVNGNINYSLIIVLAYVAVHILAGIYVGFQSIKAPKMILNKISEQSSNEKHLALTTFVNNGARKSKKQWWRKKSGIILLFVFVIMAVVPLFDPSLQKDNSYNVLYMLGRAILITLLWFTLISPLIVKVVQKYLLKKKNMYSDEVKDILDLIPTMKSLTKENWDKNRMKGIRGFKRFISDLFFQLLLWESEPRSD